MITRPILVLAALLSVTGCAVSFSSDSAEGRDELTVNRPADCSSLPEDAEVIVSTASPGDVVLLQGFAYWLGGGEGVQRSSILTGDASVVSSGGRNLAYAGAAGELACWSEYVEGGAIECFWTREEEAFTLAANEPSPLAVFVGEDAVFWSAAGAVKRATVAADGMGAAAGEAVTLFVGAEDIVDVVVHGGFVYWAGSSSHGGVSRVPVDGGEREVVSPNLGDPGNIAVDDEFIYAQHSAGISRFTVGGTPELLVTGSVYSFAIDDSHVYWTDPNEGSVKRVTKSGAEVETLATGLAMPYRIAVNECAVVWSDINDGTITRLRK